MDLLVIIASVFFVGTHKLGLVEHESASTAGNLLSANRSIPNEYIEESRSVPCPVKAGQASLHGPGYWILFVIFF
jgi:lipoate-protein ligase B